MTSGFSPRDQSEGEGEVGGGGRERGKQMEGGRRMRKRIGREGGRAQEPERKSKKKSQSFII